MLVDSLGVDTRESLEKDTFRMCYEYTYILTVIIVPTCACYKGYIDNVVCPTLFIFYNPHVSR